MSKNNDIDWREYKIHGDEVDESEDKDFLFNLFTQEDPFDIMEYKYPNIPKITLRGQTETPNSTGLVSFLR